jgi:hypothetical protein
VNNLELYEKTEKFVIDSFTNAGDTRGIPHFKQTVYWLLKLKPDADEAMRIAAISHDIERAYRSDEQKENAEGKSMKFNSPEFFRPHEEKGAEIMEKFLLENSASEELSKKVRHLISRHEEGGDDEQNLIKDADSISFFEKNAIWMATELVKKSGKEKIKEKLDWMFNRITLDKAKEFAKPMYNESIKKLNEVNE